MSRYKSGAAGWLTLAVFVVWWDYWVAGRKRGETLSMAFYRATRHPMRRWPVVAAWSVVSAHLFGFLPRRVDPIHRIGTLFTLRSGRL